MESESPVDRFGRFLVVNLRDRGIDHVDRLLTPGSKAPSRKELQSELGALTEAQRSLVRRACVDSLDSAIHAFLFALQEQSDSGGPIRVSVDGTDAASASDGLHGEPYTEDGWYARFSKHGEPPENP